jgi:sec-independent protein translocase protein TatA
MCTLQLALLLPTLGFQELLLIFLIVMVIFGATKLPQLGRGLGEGISNFKKGLRGDDSPNELEDGQQSKK